MSRFVPVLAFTLGIPQDQAKTLYPMLQVQYQLAVTKLLLIIRINLVHSDTLPVRNYSCRRL